MIHQHLVNKFTDTFNMHVCPENFMQFTLFFFFARSACFGLFRSDMNRHCTQLAECICEMNH